MIDIGLSVILAEVMYFFMYKWCHHNLKPIQTKSDTVIKWSWQVIKRWIADTSLSWLSIRVPSSTRLHLLSYSSPHAYIPQIIWRSLWDLLPPYMSLYNVWNWKTQYAADDECLLTLKGYNERPTLLLCLWLLNQSFPWMKFSFHLVDSLKWVNRVEVPTLYNFTFPSSWELGIFIENSQNIAYIPHTVLYRE